MLIRDVVIHATEGLFQRPAGPFYSELAPRDRFDLSADLWVGKLDEGTADAVLDSCKPPGRMIKKPVKQFGQLYTFVREPAPLEPLSHWDSDLRLQTCVVLSRLVHPTSISFRYAARILYRSEDTIGEIVPGPVTGYGADACVAKENHRDYLTKSDLVLLKQLASSWVSAQLPARVQRALWYHEFAARTRYIDVKWTLISTALEALVHTDRHSSTRQFTERVPQLAREVGECEFSEADAEAAYDYRSRLSHGQGLVVLSKETQGTYERMETVLRQALKRCILESEIAAIFSDDQTIRDRWPLSSAR